ADLGKPPTHTPLPYTTLFRSGIAWGEAKKRLFELLNDQLHDARDRYNRLLAEPDYIEAVLRKGADRARETSEPFLARLKEAVGIDRKSTRLNSRHVKISYAVF